MSTRGVDLDIRPPLRGENHTQSAQLGAGSGTGLPDAAIARRRTGVHRATTNPRHRSTSRVRRIAAVLLGLGILWAVVTAAGGAAETGRSLARSHAWWIVAALGAQVVRLCLMGGAVRLLTSGSRLVSAPAALGLGCVLYGLGAVTPAAPTEGLALGATILRRRGLQRGYVALVLGFGEWWRQRSLLLVAAVNALAVLASGHLLWSEQWPLAVAAGAVLVGLVVTAALLRRPIAARAGLALAKRFGFAADPSELLDPTPDYASDSSAPEIISTVGKSGALDRADWSELVRTVRGSHRRRFAISGLMAGAVLADAAALSFATSATGHRLAPHLVLLVATLATIMTWVPFIPNGFGLVEGAMPAMLAGFGVVLSDALATTVIYRAASTLLPLLAGLIALALLRRPLRVKSAARPIEAHDGSWGRLVRPARR